jgi:hypothetical protein
MINSIGCGKEYTILLLPSHPYLGLKPSYTYNIAIKNRSWLTIKYAAPKLKVFLIFVYFIFVIFPALKIILASNGNETAPLPFRLQYNYCALFYCLGTG